MSLHAPRRRSALALGALALTAPIAAGLAGCGPNSRSGTSAASDGGAALRMTWWGSETRTALTTKVIDAYAARVPEVAITAEPAEFSAYWDKLATQTAARNAPDIIQMEEAYLAEYAERGALRDLSTTSLDASGFSEGLAAAGVVGDAGQVGIRGGSNAPVMLANRSLFEAAGVDLPDDTTWTWDEFVEVAEAITAGTPEGTYGGTQLVTNPVVLRLWLRQHDAAIWRDGDLGFDEEAARGFFAFGERLLSSSGFAPGPAALEDAASPLEQSLMATGRQGLSVAWSNQAVAVSAALGEELALLRLPSAPGSAGNSRSWLKPGLFWSIAATSAAPDQAAAFLDVLLNATEVASLLGVERGVPPNTEVREAVKAGLEGVELATVEFVEAVSGEVGPDPELAPQGGSVLESLLQRVGEGVVSGDADAASAASQLVEELRSAIA